MPQALALQAAGAKAIIISDSEPDTTPVRLKGTGHEEALVTIPVIMVSMDSYQVLVQGVGQEVMVSMDKDEMGEGNPLYEEFHLKGQLMTNLERCENGQCS